MTANCRTIAEFLVSLVPSPPFTARAARSGGEGHADAESVGLTYGELNQALAAEMLVLADRFFAAQELLDELDGLAVCENIKGSLDNLDLREASALLLCGC